jgi:hypothetical protein
MAGELIIDVHAHLFRTADIGRQLMGDTATPLAWGGTADELQEVMREIGIQQAVITTTPPMPSRHSKGSDQSLPVNSQPVPGPGKTVTELRSQQLQQTDDSNLWGCGIGRTHPGLLPFVNVDPIMMDAVSIHQRLREAVAKGARGIALFPGLHGFYGNDRRAWPIYEMAQSFRLPVLAQTGDAGPLPPGGRGHWGRPRYFGDVAVSFPRLQLILGRLGKGYESEIAVLTRRYRNVYTETSTRLTGLDETGRWTPAEAVTWFRLIGVDRILMGTNWPLSDPRQVIDTIRKLSLTPEEKRKILGENAKRVLQL